MPFPVLGNSDRNRRNRLSSVLAEFARRSIEFQNVEEVYSVFAEALGQLIEFDRLVIRMVDHGSGTLADGFVAGETQWTHDPNPVRALGGTVTEAIATTGQPVVIDDCSEARSLRQFPALRHSAEGLPSLAGVALKHRGEAVGVMILRSRKKAAYTNADLEALQAAAPYIASTVIGTHQRVQLQKEVEKRTALADIGRTVSSSIDFGVVWEDFAAAVSRLFPCDRLVVAVLHPDEQTIEDKYIWGVGLPGWDEKPVRSMAGHPSQQILATRAARVSPMHEMDAQSIEWMGYRISERTGLRSSMSAPLVVGNRVVGTLNVKSVLADAYSEAHTELFDLVALQVAGSISASEQHSRQLTASEERSARAELELKNKSLIETSDTRNRFMGSITHELRTPLTSIVAASDALLKAKGEESFEKRARYLDMIGRNTRRLHELIENLLDLSDMDVGQLWLSNGEFPLYGAAKDAIAAIAPIAETKQQRLVTEFPDKEISLVGDRERVTQVLENLLSNACKYSPDYAEVKLRIESAPDGVRISVLDGGAGIPEDSISTIFDEFTRLENEVTRAATGRGLGLAISRKLARAMGGDITVSPGADRGSVFTFTLPWEGRAAA